MHSINIKYILNFNQSNVMKIKISKKKQPEKEVPDSKREKEEIKDIKSVSEEEWFKKCWGNRI